MIRSTVLSMACMRDAYSKKGWAAYVRRLSNLAQALPSTECFIEEGEFFSEEEFCHQLDYDEVEKKDDLPFVPLCHKESVSGSFEQKFFESGPKPEFDSAQHKYTYENAECISVTTFLGDLFPKFDADAVIKKYYGNWQKNDKNKYYGLTKDEIKEHWVTTQKIAAASGTAVHAAIENCFINGIAPSVSFDSESASPAEAECFEAFLNNHGGLIAAPVAIEKRLVHPKLKLAGTIDFLGQCPSGEPGKVVMVD